MPEGVVVVGGGLAGLSAAARLAARGYAVTLLEKTPKPGGGIAEGLTFVVDYP